MGNPDFKIDKSKALKEISTALSELRDALMQLSMAMKDWQFASDVVQRQKNEAIVQELLSKLGSMR
ncbi:MAG: hypothetical protein Q8K22_03505 [Rhodoferax sp.]|nr:hypothetical protein [Rhodoferax sp.]